ncbi:MAG: hypothetical protein ACKVOL_00030 [Novosphingobium sp.]
MATEPGRVSTIHDHAVCAIVPVDIATDAADQRADLSKHSDPLSPKEDTHMNVQTSISEAVQDIATMPIAGKISEMFEHNPLLTSAAAFVTTRIALRSLIGVLALGLVAGGLIYLQQSHATSGTGRDKAQRRSKKTSSRLTGPEAGAKGT